MLATGPGNAPAVRIWTGNMVWFIPRPVQNLNLQILGRPNPYPYPSTHGFCWVWLYPSVPISSSCFLVFLFMVISNNPSFRLKHPGVPDGSDGSDGTSYPLTENYMLPVAQATGRVAYSPPLLCARYTHHQNDTCVTLFAGAAVML